MTNAEARAVVREMLDTWDKVVATLRLRGYTEEEAARIARRYFDMSVGRSS